MDKCHERRSVMVKVNVALLSGCMLFPCLLSAQYTNVSQVVNRNIDGSLLAQIDSLDRSTPDTVCLAFLKTSVSGDLQGFLRLFDDQYAFGEFGMTGNTVITESMRLSFNGFMGCSSVTNRVLISYSCSFSNSQAVIHSQMRCESPSRVAMESIDLILGLSDGGWRIRKWNDE